LGTLLLLLLCGGVSSKTMEITKVADKATLLTFTFAFVRFFFTDSTGWILVKHPFPK